jgi:putative membrane protein insertion efficiency factor
MTRTDRPTLPARVLQAPVRAWRVLSTRMPPRCRFHPSCSAYALGALETHGAARGSWLAVRRVSRCHPWHPGGFDPVPPRAEGNRRKGPEPDARPPLRVPEHTAETC